MRIIVLSKLPLPYKEGWYYHLADEHCNDLCTIDERNLKKMFPQMEVKPDLNKVLCRTDGTIRTRDHMGRELFSLINEIKYRSDENMREDLGLPPVSRLE